MVASWVVEELECANLQDARLDERFAQVLSQLAAQPTASIPAACGGYAEAMAAYRFFDNAKVGFENVLEPHIEASLRRMSAQPVVLLVQDTTEVNLTRPQQQVAGAGPLGGNSRRGVFLHPMMGFTPDGTPLGTVYAEAWMREDEAPRSREQTRSQRQHTPLEDKESMRWLEAYRQAGEITQSLDQTRFVCVADSEADIYELLSESHRTSPRPDWIIRAGQDRALCQEADDVNHLRTHLLSQPVRWTESIEVRGRKARIQGEKRRRRQSRESRSAEVEVRTACVTLRAPRRYDRKLPPVQVNVVFVREIAPPKGEPPVEWMLLTSLPIDEVDQVRQVIQYYRVRWMVELFFRTLKSGCRVEARRFERVERFLPCLAIYMIVTWRTLMACRLSRALPQISCEAVFEPAEWKGVYCVVHQERTPPARPPTLGQMVRMVAQLGGYVYCTRKDEPGPQTVWLGLQRTHDIARCWIAFGPEAGTQP